MSELGINPEIGVRATPSCTKNNASLGDLLEEYNRVNQLERGNRSKETLAKRLKATRFLLRFDPNLRVDLVTRAVVLQLREWACARYKPSSVRGYFVELKALYDYALRIKLVEENPFKGITITIPHKLPVRIKISEQYRLFRFLYQTNKGLFYQALFQRLTGLRVSDACKLRWEQFDPETRLLTYHNSKGKREEEYPLSNAVLQLFELMGGCRSKGTMFEFKHGKTVADYISKGCEFAGITHFASHQLKRDYASEVGKHKPDPRTYDALLHHEPVANPVGRRHYDGQQHDLMFECLNAAQQHWIAFLNEVLDLPQLEQKHAYSSPRVKRQASS
jgi:integrase